jgi:hypothetical protein
MVANNKKKVELVLTILQKRKQCERWSGLASVELYTSQKVRDVPGRQDSGDNRTNYAHHGEKVRVGQMKEATYEQDDGTAEAESWKDYGQKHTKRQTDKRRVDR